MKKGELFYLDFSKDKLRGYENPKALSCVNALRKAIQSGDSIPPVHVYELQKPYYSEELHGSYVLSKYDGGGHHRAIAHVLEGVALPCVYEGIDSLSQYSKFQIRGVLLEVNKIQVIDDAGFMLGSAIKNGVFYRTGLGLE
ncbi:MAG: hypothetical protein WC004_04530 [Candidatus Absconditabacterales bacterium]